MSEAASETNKSYAKRFVRGSTIIFIVSVISNVIGLVLRIFLARTLGATDYGLFYAVFALVAMFGAFRDLGIGQAVVRSIPKFNVKKRFGLIKSSMTILMIVQGLFSFVAAFILVYFSDWIALKIFGTIGASIIIKCLSGWFFFEAIYYTFRGTFQGLQDFTSISLLSFFEILLPFIFVVPFVFIFGPSAAGVAFAYFVGLGITVLISFGLFTKRHLNIYRAKARVSKPLCKELFMFALPVFIGGVTAAITGSLSTLMLASVRSSAEAGFYQAAFPIANLLMYFPAAMGAVLFPMVSELWAKRKHELVGQAIHTLIKFSFVFITPVALIFIAFPDVVITMLFGSEYLAAGLALQILAVTAVVHTVGIIANRVILGMGRPTVIAWIMGITAVFASVSNIILVPLYGVEGAAVATFISTLAGLVLSLYIVRKRVKFTIPSSSLINTLFGGLLTLLMVSGLKLIINLPLLVEFLVVISLGLIFYGLWVLSTRALTSSDLALLKTTMPVPKWLIRFARKFE